jgi:Fe-S oxidoreductase
VKKILTFCPHGYNTFQNEYPKLRGLLPGIPEKDQDRLARIEVIPHVVFLRDLIRTGRLGVRANGLSRMTYHDSCYLGRHNGLTREPREIIAALGPQALAELKNNREHSFCCGAGGGLMWTDEKLGQRINHLRTDEVIASRAGLVATSCPFCLNMLSEGLKDKENESIRVKDLAQLVAASLV